MAVYHINDNKIIMEEDMRLKDQVAIVTGAGRNIGEDICRLFVQEGAKVAVVDLDPGRGNRVAGEINADSARQGNFRCLRCVLGSFGGEHGSASGERVRGR